MLQFILRYPEVGNWTKLQVSSIVTPSGPRFISLSACDANNSLQLTPCEFDCIKYQIAPCGYFYASIVALCMPSFLFAMYIGFFAKELFFSHNFLKPIIFCFAPVVTTLMPLFKIAGKVT